MTGHPAPWPLLDLDIASMRELGHKPIPFRQFILKVHGRCNLSCSYCYVYEMADQTWRGLPKRMPRNIAQATAKRIAEHVSRHDLPGVEVILHGGEPLLAGADWITWLVGLLRAEIPSPVTITVQTNGTLLGRSMLKALKDLGICVGVSLDGDADATGRHRRYADGRNSFVYVADGLNMLGSAEFREIYSGILATIDVRNHPEATYEALLKFHPPAVDLLLPHANWSSPHRGSRYADWLIAIFERWYSSPVQETRIRLFIELIQLVLGGRGGLEGLGLQPSTVIVVETDGRIRQLDSLSSAYSGAADTGLHVTSDSFDAALEHPTTVARQIGVDALAPQCRACAVMPICGGGLYPHRYRSGEGFRNPSVYCADLTKLISHVNDRVSSDLARISTVRSQPLDGFAALLPVPQDVPLSTSFHTARARRRAADPPRPGAPQQLHRWPGWPLPSEFAGDQRPWRGGSRRACPGPPGWTRPAHRRRPGLRRS